MCIYNCLFYLKKVLVSTIQQRTYTLLLKKLYLLKCLSISATSFYQLSQILKDLVGLCLFMYFDNA